MKKENERKMWNGKINKCVREENEENLEGDDVEEEVEAGVFKVSAKRGKSLERENINDKL